MLPVADRQVRVQLKTHLPKIKDTNNMGKVIGIDLGTTNSVVAVMQGGEPFIIPIKKDENHCQW